MVGMVGQWWGMVGKPEMSPPLAIPVFHCNALYPMEPMQSPAGHHPTKTEGARTRWPSTTPTAGPDDGAVDYQDVGRLDSGERLFKKRFLRDSGARPPGNFLPEDLSPLTLTTLAPG
jgi:hypothetical protein